MDKPRLGIRKQANCNALGKQTSLKLINMLITYISPKIKDIVKQALYLES
jgi:hypothetical protein